MDSYMWHQQKQNQDGVHNGSTPSSTTRNAAQASNGHGQAQQWEGYGYSSGLAPSTTNAQQTYYDPSWNMYDEFSGQIQQNISPAALLAQRAPNGSSRGQGTAMDTPTTIDPTLMMAAPFPHYIPSHQSQTQQYQHTPHGHQQLQRTSSYQQEPTSYLAMPGTDSSLSAVVDYEPPLQISPTATTSGSLPASAGTGAKGTAPSPPLIEQVKKLLTPKQLDRDPQSSAQKLIELLLPKSAADPTPTDKDERMEILTRLRDHAPREVFTVLAKNMPLLGLLREWGKNACKKEEFEETLMGWLQVVDKLPLTVDALAQSGLGKLIKYVVEHPPTTAIRDMATKIESGWKKVIASQQQEVKAEPDTRPKKRKLEATTIPLKSTTTTTGSSSATPATKKAAVMTSAGTRVAVRKDSLNSPITGPPSGAPGTTGTSTSTVPKGAQSDSGFFSKPKQKLPSFRKKPTGAPTTPTTATASSTGGDGTPPAYSNPFEDAMKSLRKSSDSPALLPNPVSSGNTIVGGVTTPGISSKTGKPKKKVRFDDVLLERIKYIERAIYDDDIPGNSGFHGQSYRDLDRAEGNLLRHMVAQIDWFEPPAINFSGLSNTVIRGESSKEATVQAEREMSALAAFYQGAPPDTPVEPPQLVAMPPTVDDSGVTMMLLGTQTEEMIQGGRPDTIMTAGHWLGQLGGDGASPEYAAGMAVPYGAPPPGQAFPPQNSLTPGGVPAGGQEGIADILSKLMKAVGPPEGTPPMQPTQPAYGAPYNGAAGYTPNPPPASGVDNAALINALTALGMIPVTQQPNDASNYGGGSYGNGLPYGAAQGSQPYGSATTGLPPPLGMPGREDQEDRWRRSAKADPAGAGKRGKRKDVPASQNTWKPLCTFFARGKCRFGEECDFSHDPAKLPK